MRRCTFFPSQAERLKQVNLTFGRIESDAPNGGGVGPLTSGTSTGGGLWSLAGAPAPGPGPAPISTCAASAAASM